MWLEEGIYHRFNIAGEIGEIPKGYNIAPGMNALTVTRNSPNRGEVMRWGLIPPWAKDINIGYKMINARAETITQRPAYRNSFRTKRCLVPFNAFYEWRGQGKDKTPFLFHDTSEPYLSFAGLFEVARDGDNKEIKSFTIITTKANKLMSGVHERMPVILTREGEEIWLEKDSSQEQLLSLFDGYKSKTFESYQVSERVNSARNNDAEIIKKLG